MSCNMKVLKESEYNTRIY